MKYLWVLYDGRYHSEPERASIYCTAESLREAKRDKREDFSDAVIVRYEIKGNQLIHPVEEGK